jgi:transcriptional regulator with XRE-family HTH domain
MARKLGARIRAIREEKGLTQEALAWDCGFAKAHLSQVEAGKGVPSLPALQAIARRLGVDAVDLIAMDATKPLHRLLDALRLGDAPSARTQLLRLGLALPAPRDQTRGSHSTLVAVAEPRGHGRLRLGPAQHGEDRKRGRGKQTPARRGSKTGTTGKSGR